MEDWVANGIDAQELAFTKSYMVKSHAFSVDTADKRLEQAVETILYDLPADYYSGFTKRVEAVTLQDVNESLATRLAPRDLVMSVVATESEIGAALRETLEPNTTEVVAYDADAAEAP
jgi:zinc protease